jgi:hypothetical protein
MESQCKTFVGKPSSSPVSSEVLDAPLALAVSAVWHPLATVPVAQNRKAAVQKNSAAPAHTEQQQQEQQRHGHT